MYQLSTVRTRIQSKLDNTAFDSQKLNQFINDGQADILGGATLPFMERETTATTAVGSDAITWAVIAGTPAIYPEQEAQKILSVRIYSPTDKAKVLPYVEYEEVDLRYPNPTLTDHNTPSFWYIFNNEVKVFPEADAVYTLAIKYIKKPTTLVNDTDVPEIPEAFGELLVLSGYKRALEHEDDYDQAQVIQAVIDDQRQNMVVRLGSRQNFGPHIIKQPRRLTRR